jgi:hypothetical protein
VEPAPSYDSIARLLRGWSCWEAKCVDPFSVDFSGGLAVYSHIPQANDFAVQFPQHTGVIRCLCTLAACLKVPLDFFRVQLLAAVYGDAP